MCEQPSQPPSTEPAPGLRRIATLIATLAAISVITSPVLAALPDAAALDTVLARHVRDGRVDYGALARDRGPLDRYLAAVARANPEQESRDEQLAFWVNAYNARVLEGILRWPGLKSVLDVGKVVGVPTLGFFRQRTRTAGRELSLDDIEHGVLRKRFREPRLHFVLNCASVSCPDLPSRALRAATLDSTLEAATRAFLSDPSRNRVLADGTLEISHLFKWYGEDFSAESGGVAGFVARHGLRPPARASKSTVRYLDYDWALNGRW